MSTARALVAVPPDGRVGLVAVRTSTQVPAVWSGPARPTVR